MNCCCSSEDCRINGCVLLRQRQSQQWRRPYEPVPLPYPSWPTVPPVIEQGWQCPNCGGVNAPFAPICFHCKPKAPVTTTTNGTG